jgi:hypothetical protein
MEDCDNERLVWRGEHLEIQISTHTVKRDRATKTGFGFYKFMVNPFDVYSDYWYNCDVPGSEACWSSGATIKSSLPDSRTWLLEMSIPIVGTMKGIDSETIKKSDGLELVMWLVPAGSLFSTAYGFGAWVPGVWTDWDKFYKVVLDPEAPVMQFAENISALNDGNLDIKVRLRGRVGMSAGVSATVLDVDNKVVFQRDQTVSLKPAEWSLAEFRQLGLNVPPFNEKHGVADGKRNRLLLRVESDGKIVYTADLPFVKHTPEFVAKTYGEYVSTVPKGDYVSSIAYIRRNGKLRITVDTDVVGNFPQAVRDAKRCRVLVQGQDGTKPLFDQTLQFVDGLATELIDLGKVTGRHTVNLYLLDEKGGVVSTRSHTFDNAPAYNWENNTIGEERVVIPPWRPIAFDGNVLKTRTAKFTVGNGGLWDAVEVLDKQILTGPMRIEGSVDGKEVVWKGGSANIEKGKGRAFPPEFDQYDYKVSCPKIPFDQLPETDGYEALVTGKGAAGPIAVSVKSVMDFDGSTHFAIQYAPNDKPVKVDRLEVVCELFGTINGLFMMREVVPSLLSLPTDKQGLLWESKSMELRPKNFYGTFVPYLRVGDGTYSLLFFAKSDKGWLLDDKVSCMRIERHGDKVQLRLLLVNAPAVIDKARTIDFVLTPMPSRTYPQASRYLVWGGEGRDYINTAAGWRKFGTGTDNWYLPTDEEYVQLYELLKTKGIGYGSKANTNLVDKLPLQIYSSVVAVGAPLPDCDSFKGQWYKDSNYDPGQGATLNKRLPGNLTGRLWDRPECFNEAWPTGGWDEDLNDNYMWFYRKLAVLSHANGINHWDNGLIRYHLNLDAGTYGYVRDDGHKQSENTNYQRWSLMKRNYVMQWLEGRPPYHNEMTYSYHNFNRYCEGPWYVYTEDGTLFENFGDLAGFRMSSVSSKTPSLVVPVIPRKGMSDLSVQRSYLALCILHDFGIVGLDTNKSSLLRKMDDEIGFLDKEKQAEFIPYWEADKALKFIAWKNFGTAQSSWAEKQPDGVYVSIFRSRTQPGKALLWFVNAGEKPVTTGIRLDIQALVGQARKDVILRNIEDGVQVTKDLPANVTAAADKETLWGLIAIPGRDFRAVIVEKGEYKPVVYNPWP